MKKLVVLLLASLVATSAFAVIDPDDNMIGIYFDVSADVNVLVVPAGGNFSAYLVATNPTAAEINGYEFGMEVTIPLGGTFYQLNSVIANGAADGLEFGVNDQYGGDYAVGLATAIPGAPATILHRWDYLAIGQFTMEWFLFNNSQPSIPGTSPVLLDANGSVEFQVGQSTGGAANAVASFNPHSVDEDTGEITFYASAEEYDGVIGVEETSFGSVKSLFR